MMADGDSESPRSTGGTAILNNRLIYDIIATIIYL